MDTSRLLFLREENDLTQEKMGQIIGVKKFSICNWEKNKEIIPLQRLNDYSNYFNVSMDYIVKLNDNKKCTTKNIVLDKNIIGKNIKKIREEKNLSQRELASILKTSHSVICDYENGKTMILTAFAYQLCKTFNLSMDWLCGRKNNIK